MLLTLIPVGVNYHNDGYGAPAVESVIISSVVLGATGAALIIYGRRRKKLEEDCEKYLRVIEDEGETDIYEIAKIVNEERATTEERLEALIQKKFIDGHINKRTHQLVLSRGWKKRGVVSDEEEAKDDEPKIVVVKCGGCGAKNKVMRGRVTKCEYCGTVLKG